MAVHKFYNAKVTIGGVDLSDHVKAVRLNIEADALDFTVMGNTTKVNGGGLLSWSVEIDFEQDYAASKVDATLWPLIGATAALVLLPDNAAASATNPQFSGTGLLKSYQPLGGQVGENHMTQASFVSAGVLSRATS